MNILESLQSLLGGASGTPATAGAGAGAGGMGGLGSGLGSLINSGAMGGIAASLLGNKKGGVSWLKTALMAGAGSMLWKKLSERMEEQAAKPNSGFVPSGSQSQTQAAVPNDQSATRLVRALVFAAKSDGHIDAQEKAAINEQVRSMNLGRTAEDMVRQAMNEPLDPRLVADGVTNPQEALQLYSLSAAVIDPDQFMEKNYLDALAQSLNIPEDVKRQINEQIQSSRQPA